MNSPGDSKPEPVDPEQLLRTMDLELKRQRAARQHEKPPYRTLRMVSFLFLFAVIVGAALAFYYIFVGGGLDELRTRNEPLPTATPASRTP